MRRLTILLLLSFLISAAASAAPIYRHDQPIPGRYMVLLENAVGGASYDGIVTSLAATYGITIVTRWTETPRGFIAENLTAAALERLAADPRIRLIEEDFYLIVSGTQYATWNNNYLWHLDRIDEPTYAEGVNDYTYDMCPEARGIVAYVLDIGVRGDHEQFNLNEPYNRVIHSRRFDDGTTTGSTDTTNPCANNLGAWHGTAVASVVAGTTVGAAKTDVVSLRYTNCLGQSPASYLVNAVRWIRSANDPYANRPGVVNYSGGVGNWRAEFHTLNDAVTALVRDRRGIPFFTSAENFNGDACMFSPNSLAYTNANKQDRYVFTVGATTLCGPTDRRDCRWQYWDANGQQSIGEGAGSGGGACVSMYAPGMDIYAARHTSTTAYDVAAGTSFASPLAAAVAARYMERTGNYNYVQVYDYLLNAAAGTGTPIYNMSTPEYWFCYRTGSTGAAFHTMRTPGTCPAGYAGVNGTSTPLRMAPTNNESGAGMIYSDMTCP